MHALAKSPDDRYQSAEEFRADLLRFTEGQPVLAGVGVTTAVGATSVMGAAVTTTMAARDSTIVVPAVAAAPSTGAVPLEAPVSEEVRRGSTSSRNTWIVLGLVVALAVVGVLAYRALAGANTISVPDVVHQSLPAATATLRGEGFVVHTHPDATSQYLPNAVISQVPPANTAAKHGSLVTLTYAVAPAPETVPQVTGLSLQDALNALKAAHLNNRETTVDQWTAPVIPGSVLAQSQPSGKTVPAGTQVVLTLLQSGGLYPVPSVIDTSAIGAASTLAQYGLSPGTSTSACSNNTALNLVSATTPARGTLVSQGTTVTLVISSGHCPVVVPNVVSLLTATAQAQITAAQLVPVLAGCASGPSSTGVVAMQSPQNPTPVPVNSQVVLTIGCTGQNSGTTGPGTGTTGLGAGTGGFGFGADRVTGPGRGRGQLGHRRHKVRK